MKRDLDLIRRILLYVEETVDLGDGGFDLLEIPEEEYTTVYGHLRLLEDAGFVELLALGRMPERPDLDAPAMAVRRMTNAGHDYLDSVRDDRAWTAVKQKIAAVGGGVSLAIAKAIAVEALEDQLGIGG